jgi:hypothetical protein
MLCFQALALSTGIFPREKRLCFYDVIEMQPAARGREGRKNSEFESAEQRMNSAEQRFNRP